MFFRQEAHKKLIGILNPLFGGYNSMKYILPTLFFAWIACLPAQAQDLLIPFVKNGKWGYCNAQKEIVIPCIYSYASFFVGDLACVSDTTNGNYWGAGNFGYINRQGKVVIPLKFALAHDFRDGYAYVEISEKLRTVGAIINPKGDFIIPPKIRTIAVPLPTTETPILRDDMICLRINIDNTPYGKTAYRYYNRAGKQVFKAQFNYAKPFSEGLALAVLSSASKYGFVDKTGKFIIPSVYDKADDFSEGLAGVCQGEKCGFIDKAGKAVIPFEYDSVGKFSEGLAAVMRAGKIGFIDKAGKVAIPCVYDAVCNFSEGLAAVSQQNKVGFINRAGEVVIPLTYDIEQLIHFRSQALFFKGGLAIMTHQEKDGAIDRTGKVIIPFRYRRLGDTRYAEQDFSTGFIIVTSEDHQTFYIDKNGVEYRE